MANRNSNKHLLTALASAGLCLTLGMLTGCGDSGSTGTSPFPVANKGLVNFKYNAPETFGAVKYAFYNDVGFCVMATDILAMEETVTVGDVPKEAVSVNAYYFSGDDVTTIGVDNIEWEVANLARTCTVSNPDFSIDTADLSYEAYPDEAVININDNDRLNLTGFYTENDGKKTVDVSPLATFTLDGRIITTLYSAALENMVKANDYGEQRVTVTAPYLSNCEDTETAVYVGDASLESLKIVDDLSGSDDRVCVVNQYRFRRYPSDFRRRYLQRQDRKRQSRSSLQGQQFTVSGL